VFPPTRDESLALVEDVLPWVCDELVSVVVVVVVVVAGSFVSEF
jgi:hypothetical protein